MTLTHFFIGAQVLGVAINIVTAVAFYVAKRDPWLALAFGSYAVACGGYAMSIMRGPA